jgi:hypothetical protein
MNTLALVQQLHQADALDADGKPGDARSLVDALMNEPDLTAAQHTLLAKRRELFLHRERRVEGGFAPRRHTDRVALPLEREQALPQHPEPVPEHETDTERLELIQEVHRLRAEVELLRSARQGVTPSGSWLIPASEVNTIVRRAAGTEHIMVRLPERDETGTEAEQLRVLRRDSLPRTRETNQVAAPTEAAPPEVPGPVAARRRRWGARVLGWATVLALLGWLAWYVVRLAGGGNEG